MRAQRRYAGIAIEVVAEGDPPPALADPSPVSQIVLNLLLNAADALCAGGPPPRIRITLRPASGRLRAGDADREAAAARRRSDAVECVVADNGPGIAEEDRERVFDPFFTTKPPGEGTGLGLANAVRFAEESGGALELLPAGPDGGAAFVLRLPAGRLQPGWKSSASDTRESRLARLRSGLRTAHAAAQQRLVARFVRFREPQATRGLGRKRAHGTRLAP